MTRVNELLKREIADLIEKRYDRKDDGLVSVTEVKTSPDLKHAHVYISVMGSEDAKKSAFNFLKKKRGLLQKKIAQVVTMKFTPVLEFKVDDRLESGDNVLSIINELESNEQEDSDL